MTLSFQDAVEDELALRRALDDADIAPTLMVLAQLSPDTPLLEAAAPYIHGPWSFMEDIPDQLKSRIRDGLVNALKLQSDAPPAAADRLQRIMSVGVGQPVSSEYIPLLIEEMRLGAEDTRRVDWRKDPAKLALHDFKVVVVGAGFSGLCAAIRLKEAGIPFVVIEKNPEVGGTWFENTYPGVGVDTPNHFFSYSFAPNNDWTHHFSKGPEIQAYIQKTATDYDIRRFVRFGTEVLGAAFDEARSVWQVRLRGADGVTETMVCNVLITAVGQLNRPLIPTIKGRDQFRGPAFHTAQWDHNAVLDGKRVAMIGTGASGMQAGPSIAQKVAKLTVFQRSPHWAMANANYHKAVTAGQRWALNHIPFFSEWVRFQLFWASSDGFHASLQVDPAWSRPDSSLNEANHRMREAIEAHIRRELDGDEALIAKCIPSYPPYGKRMLRDNHWFKMLKQPNVELVNDRIAEINADGIVMADGTLHAADAIIYATGFQGAKILWPMEIAGRGGVTIRDVWGDDDPRAYLGLTAPGFPNLFVTFGPNTNLAHGGSAIFHFECQVRYIVQALREMLEGGYATLEVGPEVHDAYNRLVDAKCANMVWAHPGVTNWYKNKQGRVTVTSPWRLVDYWELTRVFNPAEFILTPKAREADVEEPRIRYAS